MNEYSDTCKTSKWHRLVDCTFTHPMQTLLDSAPSPRAKAALGADFLDGGRLRTCKGAKVEEVRNSGDAEKNLTLS